MSDFDIFDFADICLGGFVPDSKKKEGVDLDDARIQFVDDYSRGRGNYQEDALLLAEQIKGNSQEEEKLELITKLSGKILEINSELPETYKGHVTKLSNKLKTSLSEASGKLTPEAIASAMLDLLAYVKYMDFIVSAMSVEGFFLDEVGKNERIMREVYMIANESSGGKLVERGEEAEFSQEEIIQRSLSPSATIAGQSLPSSTIAQGIPFGEWVVDPVQTSLPQAQEASWGPAEKKATSNAPTPSSFPAPVPLPDKESTNSSPPIMPLPKNPTSKPQ